MSSLSNSIPAIQVPTGGELLGFNNPYPASSECAAIINLQTQVAPLIASMSCQLKVLTLLKPLIEVIKGLPSPSVTAMEEFTEAAAALAPCLLIPAPVTVLPFVRDLLCVEIGSLNCFLRNLQRILEETSGGLSSPSRSQVRNVLDSYPPIVGTLKLADELFQIAGVTLPQASVLSAGTDLASLKADQSAVLSFTSSLQSIVDALGGCPSRP